MRRISVHAGATSGIEVRVILSDEFMSDIRLIPPTVSVKREGAFCSLNTPYGARLSGVWAQKKWTTILLLACGPACVKGPSPTLVRRAGLS